MMLEAIFWVFATIALMFFVVGIGVAIIIVYTLDEVEEIYARTRRSDK